MGIGRLKISLDNAEGVFFPGEIISGTFTISIKDQPEKLESISVECKGEAKVSIPVDDENELTDTEEYFKMSSPFIIPPHGGNKLAIGKYKHRFSFNLPVTIPSSFEYGRYNMSYVRYTLMGTCSLVREQSSHLVQKKKTKTYECIFPFTVNSIVNLNLNPEAKMEKRITKSTRLRNLFFWRSGPITVKAWVNQMGCVPGQVVYFNAQVKNLSGKRLDGSKIQLLQSTTLSVRGSGDKQKSERIILKKYHGPFDESDVWTNEPIIIPGLAPSHLLHCNIIHIDYYIQLVVKTGFLHFNLKCPIELLVGNVPNLTNNSPQKYQTSPTSLPPPRYMDSFFPRAQIDQENGETVSLFTPRYVTYANMLHNDFSIGFP